MASLTTHYGLTRLSTGVKISDNDYKYGNADRDVIDQKLYLGAEGHQHTGADIVVTAPPFAPVVTLSATVGRLPAGTTIRYKYTLVDVYGNESGPSPEATYATLPPVLEPAAPTLATSASGGTLTSGTYYYRLSAYNATGETLAQNGNFITTGTGLLNRNTLTLPSLPSGALGFNVYRLTPGGTVYHFLATVAMNVATPPTTYVDNGSVTEDCDHNVPSTNSTNISTSLLISLPGATPTVPVGYTWRLYRTFTSGDYTSSFLHWVNEYTQEATPTIHTPFYTDIGRPTQAGSPPSTSVVQGSPSKINLTGAAEVTGVLPNANVEGFPIQIEFAFSGSLSVQSGTFIWFNEWPSLSIVGVRAILGRGSTPASQNVIVDVNKGSSQSPSFLTLFTTQANRPSISVGNQYSSLAVPDTTTLTQYDMLTVDIDQAGGGATPTDTNLTVIVYLKARFY